MLQIRKVSSLVATAIAGLGLTQGLHAAIIASDNASNPPYSSASGSNNFNGQNGSSISPPGFGPWVITNSVGDTSGGAFISATTNDTTRNPAPVFDIFDNGSPSTNTTLGNSIETATRPFVTSLTGAGSSFSFVESLANLRAASGGSPTSQVGFELLDSLGNVLLNLYCNGGGPGYYVTDASNSGNPYELISTDAGRSPERALTINTASSDILTISLNDGSGDYTITSSGHEGSTFADGGQINMSTGGPAAFAFYNDNGGNGSDVRVNNLVETLVPEPATISLGGFGLFALALRRRRKS